MKGRDHAVSALQARLSHTAKTPIAIFPDLRSLKSDLSARRAFMTADSWTSHSQYPILPPYANE